MDPQNFPSQPQQISQTTSESPSKSYLPFIIGGLLILLIVGMGGFYLGKTSTKPNIAPTPTSSQEKACTTEAKICPDGTAVGRTGPNCEFTPCPTQGPSLTPTQIVQDETADWKIYSNKNFNYSIKYPNNLEIEEMGLDNVFIGNKPVRWIWVDKQIQITVSNNNPEDCRGDCPVISKKEDTNVNNIASKRLYGYIGAVGGNVPQKYQEVVIPHNNIYYIIAVYELRNNDLQPPDRKLNEISENKIKLFDQILSTFKFLD
jgi:hypothetical protein